MYFCDYYVSREQSCITAAAALAGCLVVPAEANILDMFGKKDIRRANLFVEDVISTIEMTASRLQF